MPLIKFDDISTWPKASGIEIIDNIIAQLERQFYADTFPAGVIPATKMGIIATGGGSVTGFAGGVDIDSLGGVTEAAATFAIQEIILDSDKVRTFKTKLSYNPATSVNFLAMIQQFSGTPTSLTNAARAADLMLQMFATNTNTVQFYYRKPNATNSYWNPALGIFQDATVGFAPLVPGTIYTVIFEYTQTAWRLRLRNAADTADIFAAAPWVSWGVVNDQGKKIYLLIADPVNDTYISGMKIHEIQWDDGYLTTSPIISIPSAIAIGVPIEVVPISEDNDAGASILYDYEFDGSGLVLGKTLAEINTAWVGSSPGILNQFIAHMKSDGKAQPRFNLNGGVLAGSGVGAASPVFGGGVLSA